MSPISSPINCQATGLILISLVIVVYFSTMCFLELFVQTLFLLTPGRFNICKY